MQMLVTGGAGFIGSNFVRQLLLDAYPGFEGARVTVLDKLTYSGTTQSLAEVWDNPRLTFVHGDVCDADLLADVMSGVSIVVHMAAESHVDRSIESGVDFVRTNVLGTQTLLEAAHRAEVERFVLVSTDEVYGSIETGSWSEDAPLRPNSSYSASKASGDLLALAYARTHGFPVCVTRCSNTYGPFQFPEKLVPLFVTHLLDGEPVPLYGDGLNVREWIHVDDHCRGVALAAAAGRPGEVYNLAGTTELTNLELTGLLLELVGAPPSMIRSVPERKGHDRRYSLDGSKAARELSFLPSVPFAEGLNAAVRWYADRRDWWEPLKKET